MYALQLDGWQSGRLRTLGKRVFLNRNPGFEPSEARQTERSSARRARLGRVNPCPFASRNKAVQVEREEPSYRRIVNDYISS